MKDLFRWASHAVIAFMMAASVAASVQGDGRINPAADANVSEASRRSTLLLLPLFSINTWPSLPWNYLYTPWWLQWKTNLLQATSGGSTSYGCFMRLNDNFRPSMIRQLLQERASYGSSGSPACFTGVCNYTVQCKDVTYTAAMAYTVLCRDAATIQNWGSKWDNPAPPGVTYPFDIYRWFRNPNTGVLPSMQASVVKIDHYAKECTNLATTSTTTLQTYQSGTCIDAMEPWELLSWRVSTTARKLQGLGTAPHPHEGGAAAHAPGSHTPPAATSSHGARRASNDRIQMVYHDTRGLGVNNTVVQASRRSLLSTVYVSVKPIPYTSVSTSTSTTISSFPTTSLSDPLTA